MATWTLFTEAKNTDDTPTGQYYSRTLTLNSNVPLEPCSVILNGYIVTIDAVVFRTNGTLVGLVDGICKSGSLFTKTSTLLTSLLFVPTTWVTVFGVTI